MTVAQLLLGVPSPLSALECRLWRAYFVVKSEYEDRRDKASSSGTTNAKMLGQTA